MFKKICIGMCCLVLLSMSAGIFSACGGPDYNYIKVYIQEDYYQKFDDMEFTLADFKMENAKEFGYYCYNDHKYEDGVFVPVATRFIRVYLKKTGKRYAEQAIKHLEGLDFVDFVGLQYGGSDPGDPYDKKDTWFFVIVRKEKKMNKVKLFGIGFLLGIFGLVIFTGSLNWSINSVFASNDNNKTSVESIVEKMFGDFKITSAEYLYNYDNSPCKELLANANVVAGQVPSERTKEYYSIRPCPKFVEYASQIIEELLINNLSEKAKLCGK